MNFDKALSLLEKQLAAGQQDKAFLTYRVIADSDLTDFQEAYAQRFGQILASHQGSLFIEFLQALNKFRGFCATKDPVAAKAAIEDLAERGEENACIHQAIRHVTSKENLTDLRHRDRSRLQPHVVAKVPMAVALDTFLDFNPVMEAMNSPSPSLAIHNAKRRSESGLKQLIKLMEKDKAKYEALKEKLS